MPSTSQPEPPIRYIERTHSWYDALGTANPYRYAHFDEVPFAPLPCSLASCTVALLTTAVPFDPARGAQSVKDPYNAGAKFYTPYSWPSDQPCDLRVSHVSINRRELQDDPNCWFPMPALVRARTAGRIGAITPRFYGVPTNRSQRHTLEIDAPDVVARCQADGADAALLVANCPICHQTLSLVARQLEAAGIATVVMGTALDIVEHCGVARFVFSDFPLGSAAGRPFDVASQDQTLELALSLLETAQAPRTTVVNPLEWRGSSDWKSHVFNPTRLTETELAALKRELADQQRAAHSVRDHALGRSPQTEQ
jgi:hypothetical protein